MEKELIFKTDSETGNDFKIECYEFNEDEDRFAITLGNDSELCDEDAYRLVFLNQAQAKELIEFLIHHI